MLSYGEQSGPPALFPATALADPEGGGFASRGKFGEQYR